MEPSQVWGLGHGPKYPWPILILLLSFAWPWWKQGSPGQPQCRYWHLKAKEGIANYFSYQMLIYLDMKFMERFPAGVWNPITLSLALTFLILGIPHQIVKLRSWPELFYHVALP